MLIGLMHADDGQGILECSSKLADPVITDTAVTHLLIIHEQTADSK